MSPWQQLKEAESNLVDKLFESESLEESDVTKLRRLVEECSRYPDPFRAICFRGSLAIISEHDGDFDAAVQHREAELRMFETLYKLEEENPTDGWSLQNYQHDDIRKRRLILDRLRQRTS